LKSRGMDKLHPLIMFKSDLDKCMKCGFCRELCPAIGFYNWEANSPRGRLQLLKALMDREMRRTSSYLSDRLYSCMTCAYCFRRCPAGVKTHEAFEAARAMLANRGEAPKEHSKLLENISRFGNPLGEPRERRRDWLPSGMELSEKPEILYWAGCMASYRVKETATSMARILEAAGLGFTTLGDEEGECGSVLIRMGHWTEAKKIAEENKKKIKGVGAKTLVTSCPACFKTFISDYPKLFGINLKLEIQHSSVLLERLINANKITPPKLKLKAVYHDPCYLGRHLNVYDPPRKVIKAIPGADLKEHPKSRWLSACCGAGGAGSFKYTHENSAIGQAAKRVEQLKGTGAEAIVTACPFCVMSLRNGAEELGEDIPIYDLPVLFDSQNIKR